MLRLYLLGVEVKENTVVVAVTTENAGKTCHYAEQLPGQGWVLLSVGPVTEVWGLDGEVQFVNPIGAFSDKLNMRLIRIGC